jgi:SAM-dependent methyltransferase
MLDVACGGGRHIGLGLVHGLSVVGVDRDIGAANRFSGRDDVSLVAADLEAGAPWPLADRRFSAVVVTNYLWRPILGDIVSAVDDSGVLIYETFASGNAAISRPSNPDFLLQPGELLAAVHPGLATIAYEHVRLEAPARVVERICAVGRRHPWLETGGPAV